MMVGPSSQAIHSFLGPLILTVRTMGLPPSLTRCSSDSSSARTAPSSTAPHTTVRRGHTSSPNEQLHHLPRHPTAHQSRHDPQHPNLLTSIIPRSRQYLRPKTPITSSSPPRRRLASIHRPLTRCRDSGAGNEGDGELDRDIGEEVASLGTVGAVD